MSPGKLESHVRTSEPLGSYSLKLKFMKLKLICGLMMLLLSTVNGAGNETTTQEASPPAQSAPDKGKDVHPKKPHGFDKSDNFRAQVCQEYIKRMLATGNKVPCKGWCVKVGLPNRSWCRCRSTKQTQKTGEECGEWQACRIIKLNDDGETYTAEWMSTNAEGECVYTSESKPFTARDLHGLYHETQREKTLRLKKEKRAARKCGGCANTCEGCDCSCICGAIGECLGSTWDAMKRGLKCFCECICDVSDENDNENKV